MTNTRIALLGQPNSGKSTVYNALTGSRQHVGNWPGKTVERNDGYYTYNGTRYTVTDLPGSYGLSGNSDEELITAAFIKMRQSDLTCILVDASQLERSMFMVAEFALLQKPAVVLLNMMDVAKAQKKEIDAKLLSERLGVPVLPFTAAESRGYDGLRTLLAAELSVPHTIRTAPAVDEKADAMAQSEAKYRWVAEMLDGVTHTAAPDYRLSRFDRVATSPVKGKFGLCADPLLYGADDVDRLQGLRPHACALRSAQRYDHGAATLSQGSLEAYPEGSPSEGMGYFQTRLEHSHTRVADLLYLLFQRKRRYSKQPPLSHRYGH